MDGLLGALCVGAVLAGVLFVLLQALRGFLYVCRPSEILIFSGRRHVLADGTVVGHRVVHGGWTIRVPFLEQADHMDLRTLPIQLQVKNAYSKGGIPLNVHAVAYVKVSSNPNRVNHAIERFLGRNPDEIKIVARESLEGQLRGIIARMTPEEINEDRLRFAEEMIRETTDDFERLGLALDTLKVQSVSDDVSYLDSIGRERLANVIRDAEIAESTAKADASEAEAEARRRGEIAGEQAETSIKRRENALRETIAQLEATAQSEEEKAEQAARRADAIAEQRLQEIRVKLQNLKLQADVVLPAAAAQQASTYKSQGDAAPVAADGVASAAVLKELQDVWVSAGKDARDIFLLQQIEETVRKIASRVSEVDLGEVVLLDGGRGDALANHVASLPKTVASVFQALQATTGIDVVEIVSGTLKDVRTPPKGA